MGELDRRVKLGAATAGIVLAAGLAGWGGSMIALSGVNTSPAAASNSTVKARSTESPAASAPIQITAPTGATTTQPTASPPPAPSRAASTSSSPARRTSSAPQTSGAPVQAPAPIPPPPDSYEPDVAFVGPWRDSGNGQWYYQVGLVGFPAETVVEISGVGIDGNARVAPLVLTTAEGSWNPFTAGFGVTFAYGGTCDAAEPATVTARGRGFAISETAPRPRECDGGTTPDGPWTRPVSSPTPAAPSAPSTSRPG